MNKEANTLPASSLHAGLRLSKAIQFETYIFIENQSFSVSETTDWHCGTAVLFAYLSIEPLIAVFQNCGHTEVNSICLITHGLGPKIQRLLYNYTTNQLCSDRTEVPILIKTKSIIV